MSDAVAARREKAMLGAAVAHHEAGRYGKALPHFRKYLKRRPDDVAALNMASFAAFEADQAALSLHWLNAARAAAPDDAQTFYNLGLVSQSVGLYAEAAEAYRRAAALEPDLASAHYNLGTVLNQLGDLDGALAAYDLALEADPGHAKALSDKGFVLRAQGKAEEAAAAYGRAAAAGDPAALTGLGRALQDAGRLSEAAAAFERAVRGDPDGPEATSALADILVQRGEAAAAVAACDGFLARHPANASVLAAKSVALRDGGATAAARALADPERFVIQIPQTRAPGFRDVAAFNDAMVEHALNHPSLIDSPSGHATRQGKHTADLTRKPKGPVAAFERMVAAAVDEFARRLGPDDAHPFIANRPRKWHLAVWAIVLAGEGYQVPHIHRTAWASGVYYAQVPDIVGAGGEAGWIEFGDPGPDYHGSAPPETRRIRPEPGLMVLFPSYIFHRTIPFESDQTRVSIAFDVVPDGV